MLLPVVALTACGQRKSAAPELPADPALRLILGVRSLSGSFTLPPGAAYFEVAVLDYEDGKVIKQHPVMGGGPIKLKRDRHISPVLLWGNVGGKMMVSVSLNGGGGPFEDSFWSHIDGGWSSIPNSAETTPDGWAVLGFGGSQAPRDPKREGVGACSNLGYQLQGSKYVGALVVRTFKSEDEWRRGMKDNSKAAQEAAKAGGA
jgi:hypothetical protein